MSPWGAIGSVSQYDDAFHAHDKGSRGTAAYFRSIIAPPSTGRSPKSRSAFQGRWKRHTKTATALGRNSR